MRIIGKFANFGDALLLAGALVVGLFASEPANPQPFAFGTSSYDGNETLTLSTRSGAALLNTNGFQGWFSNCCTGPNEAGPSGDTDYFTGQTFDIGPTAALLNDFFAFQIAGQGLTAGSVTGATLSVSPFNITDDLTYRLGDATALANAGALYDGSSPNPTIYDALGVGGFGNFALTPGESNTKVSFTLNGAAVSAINADLDAGDTYFAVGGSVNASTAIPEPSTWAMMLIGFVGFGYWAYRKAKGPALLGV
jgi:PEP-CTERM motif